jgi:Raf kinase inhibitor-like YbhB/YbcL family protein
MSRHCSFPVWFVAAAFLGLFIPLLVAGCSSGETKADLGGRKAATMTLTSTAFAEGQPIPPKYTADGEDVSPALTWSAPPEGTKALALVCDDPDAPRAEPWVHWVIYDIPADAKGLPEGVPRDERPPEPAGAVQGKNSWPDGQNLGYRGPDPPKGKVHHYDSTLYALDASPPAEPGMTKEELLGAMSGHVIGRGQLMGTYER